MPYPDPPCGRPTVLLQPQLSPSDCPGERGYGIIPLYPFFLPIFLLYASQRVINALVRKSAERNKKKVGSAHERKVRWEDRAPQKEIPEITIIEEKEEAQANFLRKRKVPGTPGPANTSGAGGEAGSLPHEAQPIRQVRPGSYTHVRVMRGRASLLDIYKDDLR